MKLNKLKGLLLLGLTILGVALFISSGRLGKQASPSAPLPSPQPTGETTQTPKIISTNPDPLEGAVLASDQEIEIVFSRSLENEGELKLRFDPKVEYKITLSQDRKTAKIIPQTPFELGVTYTLFILPDSKFDGAGEWRQEKIYHFNTIKYRGV